MPKYDPTRSTWSEMVRRCRDPKHGRYAEYGGCGIDVHEAWVGPTGYAAFLQDMGAKPVGLVLGRADTKGPYTPANCRWLTWSEANRASARGKITYQGKTLSAVEWAEETGLPAYTIRNRLGQGLPLEQVFAPSARKPREEGTTVGSRPEHAAWRAMVQRCTNPRHQAYSSYGARGIRVCERWATSFIAFLEDMGPRPSPHHSLDRVDNGRGYEPSNCRWAERIVQARNTRRNFVIECRGVRQSLVEWAESRGIEAERIRNRLRSGWSADRALEFELEETDTHATTTKPKIRWRPRWSKPSRPRPRGNLGCSRARRGAL
jgi:hypothetical protein